MLYYDIIDINEGMILLKVIKGENVGFVTISFLIMESNFKIMYAMVVMIEQCI